MIINRAVKKERCLLFQRRGHDCRAAPYYARDHLPSRERGEGGDRAGGWGGGGEGVRWGGEGGRVGREWGKRWCGERVGEGRDGEQGDGRSREG